jgi:hypothetical protein
MQWREQAQLKVHEALQKNVQALSDDVGVLDTYLGAVRAAIASGVLCKYILHTYTLLACMHVDIYMQVPCRCACRYCIAAGMRCMYVYAYVCIHTSDRQTDRQTYSIHNSYIQAYIHNLYRHLPCRCACCYVTAVRQAQRAAALVELQAQLQQLADTESESALALHALRSQVYECMMTHI